jgi:hypothetical protein
MKDNLSIINLDYIILILIIIAVGLFIVKYFIPDFSNNNKNLLKKKNKIINKQCNSELVEDFNNIINEDNEDIYTELINNYNNMNNLPYLINPKNTDKGFLKNKVKLVENPNSPLLKLDTKYKNKINQNIYKCPSPPKQFFDGYNKYNDLRKVNYANVTSIGKNLIVPYTSFPIAS